MTATTLAALGKPLFTARSSELYPWSEDRVLKLYYPGTPTVDIDRELLNTTEAFSLGGTRMACYGKVEIEGRSGIILHKVSGNTLNAIGDGNPLKIFGFPKTLAQLHAAMHNLKTEHLTDIKTLILECLEAPALAFLDQAERAAARAYIQGLPDGNALLHMDFHTDNILVEDGKEIVIDWMTAARGAPEADLAMVYFLFNEAELFPGISKMRAAFYNLLRKSIYQHYMKHYRTLRDTSDEAIQAWYLPIIILRLRLWSAPTEVAPLRAKIRARIAHLSDATPAN